MSITKIKYDLKQVTIREVKEKDDELEVISKDEPMPAFIEAFNEFEIHLVRIAEQETDSEVEIRGLTFCSNEKQGEGLIITGLKLLSTGYKLLINTPISWEQSWTTAMVKDVEKVKQEAKKYLDGSRRYKQEVLFDQDFDKDQKTKEFEEAKKANNALMAEVEGKGTGTKLRVKLKEGKN